MPTLSAPDTVTLVTVATAAFTVTAFVPLLVVSTVEVACTVKLAAVSSAATVSRPVLLTCVSALLLPVTLQVTVCAGLFVPVTVALSCTVEPFATSSLADDTVTLVTVAGSVTVTFLEPLTAELPLAVAITFRLLAVSSAATVSRPAALTDVPVAFAPITVQVTSCEGVPVPLTVALNCSVAPLLTALALPAAVTLTLVMTGTVPDIVTLAVPLKLLLAMLVAFTVMLVAVSSAATNRCPVELMLVAALRPVPEIVHCTSCDTAVPETVALKSYALPFATVAVAGDTVTPVTPLSLERMRNLFII